MLINWEGHQKAIHSFFFFFLKILKSTEGKALEAGLPSNHRMYGQDIRMIKANSGVSSTKVKAETSSKAYVQTIRRYQSEKAEEKAKTSTDETE